MTMSVRVLLVSMIGGLVVGCSSSSSGDSGTTKSVDSGTGKHDGGSPSGEGGSSGMSVTAFCNALVSADATLFSRCLGGTVSAWQAELAATTSCAELAAAVAAGRVTYDANHAAACLAAYATLECGGTSGAGEPAACTDTIAGTVSPSGTCFSTIDCAGENFCSGLGGATGSCTGTCTPLIAAGQPCTTADRCVSGYTCSGTGTSLSCTAIATPSGASAGATCGYDATTMKVTTCATGLVCNAKTLVCVTPVASGAACTPGAGECEYFTDCDPTTKTCKAYPGVGGGCGAAAGQDYVGCSAPAYCQPSSSGALVGTCTAPGGTGAACSSGAACASGACSTSDGGVGTCFAACTEE